MKGANGLGTIKFTGYVGGLPIQILVDGGNFDNFLQPRIAQFLKLPVEPTTLFKVIVGNGHSMEAEGLIQQLNVKVQGHEIKLSVYLLLVSGADLILGASWLATLGPYVADYANLCIEFSHQDQIITLQGDTTHHPTQAQFHHIKRLQQTNAISEAFTIHLSQPEAIKHSPITLPDHIDPTLSSLLHTYKHVFLSPTGLHPPRIQNHTIPLQEGAPPVKVHPYRYPHSQKEQIEKMIKEMLDQGIIQPSTSPYSSPILLVKKKDGDWRFCTDYRALNAITIKDCFPMPTVDELIDELFDAQYFSKLDLRSGFHQILVQPEDRHKTAFRTHQGHYE
ncbi:putative nucleotidyltransferase, Ribonuclease H [Lupinus albus]|uniref:Putative nucleotidyltransferase, Ribonuclease H n=1 Tax=Lupinus albus TaxID=3870 RepID=A0A6A4N2M7_LUPAL|nr:putative nucleotidyltransferase, Ribonuclease H [Lupinus albus]